MWNANGTAVSEWWLYVGTSPGARDILDSGSLGSATSMTVNNLPTDGSTVYARLFYRNGSAVHGKAMTLLTQPLVPRNTS